MDIIADEYDENAASTRVDTLYSLKALKNSIVGNPVAKNRVVTDKSVPLVVGWLNATLAETGDEENELLLEKIRIEAAHVVSSLAYDSASGTLELLRYSSLQALLHAILHLQPDDSFELRLALCRALKSIVVSCAEIVGPSLWGLGREYDPDTKEAARSALEELFQLFLVSTSNLTPSSSDRGLRYISSPS
ncbi:hypothetical protein FRC03_005080 [Tulasnella sp. 419]|nr:hypothetical protein FRC03_005080 [Tulasnella sp. 419]